LLKPLQGTSLRGGTEERTRLTWVQLRNSSRNRRRAKGAVELGPVGLVHTWNTDKSSVPDSKLFITGPDPDIQIEN